MGRYPLSRAPGDIAFPALGLRLALFATVVLTGCGDGAGPAGLPAQLQILSGDNQVGVVGDALNEPLRVRVLDGAGRSLSGVTVEFEVSPDGGTVVSDAEAAALTLGARTLLVTTDDTGVGAAVWTLSTAAGEHRVSARVEAASAIEFRATARAGPPVALVINGGDGQLGIPGQQLAEPLRVMVRDRHWNGVPEVEVSFAVTEGDGSVTASALSTNAAGIASMDLRLGAAVGLNRVTAMLGDLGSVEYSALGVNHILSDATSDVFTLGISGNYVLPDIVGLGAGWAGDELIVGFRFAEEMALASTGQLNLTGGVVDFDIDADVGTGLLSTVDINRPGAGSTGMGVEIFVDIFGNSAGDFIIFDTTYAFRGTTRPTVQGRLFSFAMPSSLIGTGPLRIGMVVATVREPTDIAPEDGSLLVSAAPPNAAAARRVGDR